MHNIVTIIYNTCMRDVCIYILIVQIGRSNSKSYDMISLSVEYFWVPNHYSWLKKKLKLLLDFQYNIDVHTNLTIIVNSLHYD